MKTLQFACGLSGTPLRPGETCFAVVLHRQKNLQDTAEEERSEPNEESSRAPAVHHAFRWQVFNGPIEGVLNEDGSLSLCRTRHNRLWLTVLFENLLSFAVKRPRASNRHRAYEDEFCSFVRFHALKRAALIEAPIEQMQPLSDEAFFTQADFWWSAVCAGIGERKFFITDPPQEQLSLLGLALIAKEQFDFTCPALSKNAVSESFLGLRAHLNNLMESTPGLPTPDKPEPSARERVGALISLLEQLGEACRLHPEAVLACAPGCERLLNHPEAEDAAAGFGDYLRVVEWLLKLDQQGVFLEPNQGVLVETMDSKPKHVRAGVGLYRWRQRVSAGRSRRGSYGPFDPT